MYACLDIAVCVSNVLKIEVSYYEDTQSIETYVYSVILVKPQYDILAETKVVITKLSYKCKWCLTSFYTVHHFYSTCLQVSIRIC